MKIQPGAKFFINDDVDLDDQADPTLAAIHQLAAAVHEIANKKEMTFDFAPLAGLIKQVQDSQERIVRELKQQQPKRKWLFHVAKQSNGNMTIEAKEQ